MFQGKTLLELLSMGGFTMYLLLFCSVLSIGVILERYISFGLKSKIRRAPFMKKIRAAVKGRDPESALRIYETSSSPLVKVVCTGIKLSGQSRQEVSNAMEREITIETIELERYTGIVGTIGNIAVYIGLFGTVLGIIRSFHDISMVGTGGMSVVIGGISEALLCTATGLLVAVPAVIFYNYFVRRIDNFANEMELCASELLDILFTESK